MGSMQTRPMSAFHPLQPFRGRPIADHIGRFARDSQAAGELLTYSRDPWVLLPVVRFCSAHRPVALHSHLRVRRAPNLSGFIKRHYPKEIEFLPVVDHRDRVAFPAIVNRHRQGWIELSECHRR